MRSGISRRRWARAIEGGSRRDPLVVLHADVDQTIQEGANGQYDRLAADADPALGNDPATRSPSMTRSSQACWKIFRFG